MPNLNRKFLGLCVGLALTGASLTATASNGDDIKQLLNQGHFWFEQGRPDFSREAWQKVLLIDPGNREATAGIAELEQMDLNKLDQSLLDRARSTASAGNYDKALKLYNKVFRAYGGTPPTSYLQAEYYMALGGAKSEWSRAHSGLATLASRYPSNKRYRLFLAKVKTFSEATRADGVRMLQPLKYDKDFGDQARSAWNEAIGWLGGSDENWIDNHQQLVELYRENPEVSAYGFALGKLKTYRENTRREGIELLRSTASDSQFGSQSITAWRQALLWMGGTQDDRWMYDEILKHIPNDSDILSKRADLPPPPSTVAVVKKPKPKPKPKPAPEPEPVMSDADIRGIHIMQGYGLLDGGLSGQAIEKFNYLLTRNPGDAEALKGLGITYMRLENFQEAERYLSLALEASPYGSDDIASSLYEAQFWSAFHEATWQFKQGNYTQAFDQANQAQAMRPNELDTNLLVARIEAAQQNPSNAAYYYERALQISPGNPEAVEGLSGALTSQGFSEETGQKIAQYNLPDGEYLAYRNMVEAASLRAEASQAASNQEGIELLTRAQRLQPQDPWVRLDLARRYRTEGRNDIALALLSGMISAYPNYPDAYHAKAIYHAQYNELYEGIQALESIPNEYRNQQQAALYRDVYRELWIKQKKLEGDQLVAIRDFSSVRGIIAEMEQVEQHDPDAMLLRAELLADIGEQAQAMAIVDQIRHLARPDDIGFKSQIATVMLKARATNELQPLLAELESNSANFTNSQKHDLDLLRLGLALQNADDLRQAGQYKKAMRALQPMLGKFGSNETLLLSRAAIFKESGDHKNSRKIYEGLLRKDPKNRAAYAGLAGSYMDKFQYKEARTLVDKGLSKLLDAPELLALRGKLKAMRGEYNSAAQDLQQSLYNDFDSSQTSGHGQGGGASMISYQRGSWQADAQQELRKLNNQRINNVFGGVAQRTRDGDAGLNQFSETSLPVLIRNFRDYETYTGLSLQAVNISAGTLDGAADDASRFGEMVLLREDFMDKEFDMSDSGLGISGFYRTRNFMVDLGTTPVGFTINNVVGGLHWLHRGYRSDFSASVTRRAVKDSVLSYAGAKDPASTGQWGAAAKSGLDVRFSRGVGQRGVYAQGGYHVIDGQDIIDNDVASAKGGLYWRLFENNGMRLSTGLNASWQSFDKNSNFFTWGHGGYFSPQNQVVVSVPMELQGRSGDFSFRVGADVGQQDYESDGALVFPIDADLQQLLETEKATENLELTTVYNSESVSDIIFNVRGEAEYALSPSYALGGWINATSVDDFEEFRGGIYLRRYSLPRTDNVPLFTDDVKDKIHELW